MKIVEAMRLGLCNGQEERVRMLLGEFPSLSLKGHALLVTACCNRRLGFELLLVLLQRGAEVNEMDKEGWTPLRSAVKWNRMDLLQFLFAQGADLNFKDLFRSKDCTVWFLIRNGADVFARNLKGESVLDLAEYDADKEMILTARVAQNLLVLRRAQVLRISSSAIRRLPQDLCRLMAQMLL
ncbi:hypothetical protein BASA81_006338 [Batrachochytrium salamandrivorans]|nr:hypothetical protein BASA81_006338 [Batrachochytrium salamandrivorans]